MATFQEDPIESGPTYRTTEVDGRDPRRLDEFAGENTMRSSRTAFRTLPSGPPLR
jgi:hypothetical protein